MSETTWLEVVKVLVQHPGLVVALFAMAGGPGLAISTILAFLLRWLIKSTAAERKAVILAQGGAAESHRTAMEAASTAHQAAMEAASAAFQATHDREAARHDAAVKDVLDRNGQVTGALTKEIGTLRLWYREDAQRENETLGTVAEAIGEMNGLCREMLNRKGAA